MCKFWLIALAFLSLSSQEGKVPYPRVPAKNSERCLVCGLPLNEQDVALLVRGRRVPLKRAMVDSFMNNQEAYFAKLQPKAALFQENLEAPAGVAQGGVSFGWFLFGATVLLALVFAGLSGYSAVSKGLAPLPYFFIGFFLNVFGYAYVLSRPSVAEKGTIPKGLAKVPDTGAPVACAKCGNANHPSANACSSCGAKLTPLYQSEVKRARP